MLSRTGLRASHLLVRPFPYRTLFQSAVRRTGHGVEDVKLVGAADNAFNRDRLAVKQHAAATAGECLFHFPLAFRSQAILDA